jgi:hypothetical protein
MKDTSKPRNPFIKVKTHAYGGTAIPETGGLDLANLWAPTTEQHISEKIVIVLNALVTMTHQRPRHF